MAGVVWLILLFTVAGIAQDRESSNPVGRAAELRDRGQFKEAIVLLRQYVADDPGHAGAHFMLGETLYWVGDWSGAKRSFTRALSLDPGLTDARRQLDEILEISRSWITLAASHRRDDQPLQRSAGAAEAGVFLTPLQQLVFHVEPQRFGEQQTMLSGDVDWRAYWPGSGLDTELGMGLLHRKQGAGDWTGRASLGVRFPHGIALQVKAERAPYLWTLPSVLTPVTTDAVHGIGTWSGSGWMSEAGYGVERFSDGNQVRSAYAWFLAPVAQSPDASFHLGYSFAFADADESRWSPPAVAGGEGSYFPYFTPDDQRVHSVLFATALPIGGGVTFRANGGIGVSARELSPPMQLGDVPAYRSFRSANGRASLELPLTRGVSLTFSGEHARTAFWRMNLLGASLTYRFSRKPL